MPQFLTSDGVCLQCRSTGHGPGILLVHGFTGAQDDWAPQVDWLARRGRVVSYDLRGHGVSGRAATYSIECLVSDAAELIAKLQLAPVVVAGHSLGGIVAQKLALDHPGVVGALVLMDTSAAPVPITPPIRQLAEAACMVARTQGMETLLALSKQVVAQGLLGDAAGTGAAPAAGAGVADEREAANDRKFLATDPEAYAQLLMELGAFTDLRPRLRSLGVPTLVMVGAHDVPMRKGSRDLAATIPGARLRVIEDAGHSPQGDMPVRWREAVERFLDDLDQRVTGYPGRSGPSGTNHPEHPQGVEAEHLLDALV